jgi:hypothetical protein
MCEVEEMKLREPKNDAQRSNYINPLLSVAEGSAKRDAWRMRTMQQHVMTQATKSLGGC